MEVVEILNVQLPSKIKYKRRINSNPTQVRGRARTLRGIVNKKRKPTRTLRGIVNKKREREMTLKGIVNKKRTEKRVNKKRG